MSTTTMLNLRFAYAQIGFGEGHYYHVPLSHLYAEMHDETNPYRAMLFDVHSDTKVTLRINNEPEQIFPSGLALLTHIEANYAEPTM